MRQKDVLLQHPYQSFTPVADFVRQAAADPDVLAIKQTLYRTGADSQIVDALVDAAQAGKDVTVIIELRARFDEAANIELATRLQEAGAHVMYGVVGYKTHAKLIMVVGAKAGTCVATATSAPATITSRHRARLHRLRPVHLRRSDRRGSARVVPAAHEPRRRCRSCSKLLQSPFTLHDDAHGEDRARSRARARRRQGAHHRQDECADRARRSFARSIEASGAGVNIDLIVRGICALRPGMPGVSENIRVRSIVGRFLEHSRVYYFHEWRRGRDLLRQRRLDGAQFLPPHRGRLPDPAPEASRAHPA